MKLVVAQEHALYFNGGIRYLYEVTRRLAKDYEISLIVQDISNPNQQMFEEAGVEVLNMKETTANKLRYWIFYPYYLAKHSLALVEVQFKYGFDVWISSSPTTHILCWLAGIKPILVVFELNPWIYSIEFQRGLSKTKRFIVKCGSILAKWLEKKAYQNAQRIIVYSKYIQSEVKRVYRVDSEVVYTGVDSDFFKPTHNPGIEDRYKNKQVILHVASYLSPMKGTDLAVEAMGIVNKEFPNALLLIINSHNDVNRQYELFDKANECGAYIRFVTSVKDADLPVYYSMAKCLLSPSLDENVHLPVLEASACQCPVVFKEGTMDAEDINYARAVMAWDIESLAHGISFLLNGEYVRELLGRQAREFVMERFSWGKCLDNYKRIIGMQNDR